MVMEEGVMDMMTMEATGMAEVDTVMEVEATGMVVAMEEAMVILVAGTVMVEVDMDMMTMAVMVMAEEVMVIPVEATVMEVVMEEVDTATAVEVMAMAVEVMAMEAVMMTIMDTINCHNSPKSKKLSKLADIITKTGYFFKHACLAFPLPRVN